MSDFIGARISLISKSDIRYSGVLHEINSEESTVSLENVISYGTEGRKNNPAEEIPPADQIYEYIVFRGSDVKDLRIEESAAVKEQPAVPNDPAILNARPHPGNSVIQQIPQDGPSRGMPQGPPPNGNMGFMPPNMPMPPHGWSGAPPRNFQYPPPPGWYPPGPQGFGPSGPAWNSFYPGGPPPFGPGGPGAPGDMTGLANAGRSPQQQQQQPARQPQPPAAEARPSPIGQSSEKKLGTASRPVELMAEPKPSMQPQDQAVNKKVDLPLAPPASVFPVIPKTTADGGAEGPRPISTGPRNTAKVAPMTSTSIIASRVTASASQSTTTVTTKQATDVSSSAALRDATQAAKAAVAVAMAKLEGGSTAAMPGAAAVPATYANKTAAAAPSHYANGSSAMDNLTRKVNEMRVNAGNRVNPGNYHTRGRGRGGALGAGRPARDAVLQTDFDFETANAKFEKVSLVKEAGGAGGLSLPDPAVASTMGLEASQAGEAAPAAAAAAPVEMPATEAAAPAYNKTTSFFDNISSEAKDRVEKGSQKAGGREWRGEEQRRNMETFGQGSVDGGHRGYRGRGRGRGRGGYGRGRGGGYRRNNAEHQGTMQ